MRKKSLEARNWIKKKEKKTGQVNLEQRDKHVIWTIKGKQPKLARETYDLGNEIEITQQKRN